MHMDFGRALQAAQRRNRQPVGINALRATRLPAVYWEWQKRRRSALGSIARKIEWCLVRPLRRIE